MKLAHGDLWTYPADWRVVTTNGSVRRDGRAVMGRGCAKDAAHRYPDLPMTLGSCITYIGHQLYVFPEFSLITFPVKYHWMDDADLGLIERSVFDLRNVMRDQLKPGATIVIPRPGCGNGRLDWPVVRPLLESLPDTVTVITFPGDLA